MSSDVTLKHIAEELGVSAMTVSRALNDRPNVDEKTKEKVIETAKRMGYTPNQVAKSLVSNKTHTIGVVIPEITHAFFPEVVRGIEEVTNDSDYQIFLTNANEQFSREKKAVRALQAQRVDGILISSSQTVDDFSFYKEIINSGTRVVFFDRCIENMGVSCVSVNDRVSSTEITEHLITEHKFKKIAYISGPQDVSVGHDRYMGFVDAMEKHTLPLKEKWIVRGGFQEEAGYDAMQELLALPVEERPEAVVTVNDPSAIGAIQAISEKGLSIPEDIAIVGFTDDIRAELLKVPLTTVRQPAYEVGRLAALKLIQTIENKDEPEEILEVQTELKIRSSCGCS
ncbi:LacI family DNA-binding transcriptional regulator [Fodinibius sediminis]|uniref:Transcriptional regulator, LacI family n=1 Tax=Fodinibius sediminis TaxID=1214077 RepID=A0A521CTS5_9BACT|nr:LacI family DNA-binding transcriptional regulator [Fodinibius sediminis]SMO62070.1 transcriptional regulator, LacI family [Fodinibius sediminis]